MIGGTNAKADAVLSTNAVHQTNVRPPAPETMIAYNPIVVATVFAQMK